MYNFFNLYISLQILLYECDDATRKHFAKKGIMQLPNFVPNMDAFTDMIVRIIFNYIQIEKSKYE